MNSGFTARLKLAVRPQPARNQRPKNGLILVTLLGLAALTGGPALAAEEGNGGTAPPIIYGMTDELGRKLDIPGGFVMFEGALKLNPDLDWKLDPATGAMLSTLKPPDNKRFKVRAWVDVTGSDDGLGLTGKDTTLEIYGRLRVDGRTWWVVESDEAIDRDAGQKIDLSDDTKNRTREFVHIGSHRKLPVSLLLRDHDAASADDDVFNKTEMISVADNVGKELTFDWASNGGESARLHLHFEEDGTATPADLMEARTDNAVKAVEILTKTFSEPAFTAMAAPPGNDDEKRAALYLHVLRIAAKPEGQQSADEKKMLRYFGEAVKDVRIASASESSKAYWRWNTQRIMRDSKSASKRYPSIGDLFSATENPPDVEKTGPITAIENLMRDRKETFDGVMKALARVAPDDEEELREALDLQLPDNETAEKLAVAAGATAAGAGAGATAVAGVGIGATTPLFAAIFPSTSAALMGTIGGSGAAAAVGVGSFVAGLAAAGAIVAGAAVIGTVEGIAVFRSKFLAGKLSEAVDAERDKRPPSVPQLVRDENARLLLLQIIVAGGA